MSAAFDTVDHQILLRRLQLSYGFGGQVLQWVTSFLTDRTQLVAFAGARSTLQSLLYGVPQGSVLGPLLFALYSADVIKITASHWVCIHAYADDMQTYASCTAPDQQMATSRLLACVADIETWMTSNRLKLNAGKTEFIWLGSRHQLVKISPSSLLIKGQLITPLNKVCDLGVILDSELSMDAHVQNVARGCFYQLRQSQRTEISSHRCPTDRRCRFHCQSCRLLQWSSVRRFCGSHSSATNRWCSTLLPGWLLVPGSLSTSLRLSATCSTGCRCVNGYLQGRCYRLRLYPWHWPCILQARLHAGRWRHWSGASPFRRTPRHAGPSYENRTRPTELPSCSTNRLELSAGTPTLDTDQSQTVQRWAEVPSVHRSLLLILWEHMF